MGGGASPGMGGGKQVSEEEAADANQRNRAISSSAISRAMSDANTGQYIMVNGTSLFFRYLSVPNQCTC